MIPFAALAAVLIFTGYKLCKPSKWIHMAHVGREQIILFTLTVVVTLMSDLLIGIMVGVAAKLLMSLFLVTPFVQGRDLDPIDDGGGGFTRPSVGLTGLFRNPVSHMDLSGNACHLYFDRPLVCFNLLAVDRALSRIPETVSQVFLHITKRVPLVDHTTCDSLYQFAEDFRLNGRGEVKIDGLDQMQPCSHDRSALRLAPTALAARHHAGLQTLARISLGLSEPALAPEAALAHHGLVSPHAAVTDVVSKPLAAGVSWIVRISRDALKSMGEPEVDAPKRSLDHFSMATGDPIPHTDCKFSVWRMPAPRTNGAHATVNGDQEPRRVM